MAASFAADATGVNLFVRVRRLTKHVMDDDRAGDVCDADVDGNGVDEAASSDDDGDGVPDAIDSCQFTANADQADVDQDGIGDACDGDVGNDGQADGLQALCSADGVTGPVPDGDGDGIPDCVTTPGQMHGEGFILSGADKYAFRFDLRERASGSERGSLSLPVHYGKQPVVDKKGRTRFEKSEDARFRATAITFVAFSDDPTIRPGRARKVQIDTVRFSGLGEWHGQAGYAFEVVASDQGEPGRHRESIAIVIRDATGLVVAQVSGDLDGGNVQSKRIQH